MSVEESLAIAVQKVIDDYRDHHTVSPAWVATRVMVEIQFPRELHALGYAGCHLELRQIARHKLRRLHEPEENMQSEMFAETLQDRYPRKQAKANDEPVYVRRDFMTDEDVEFNVERMRRGGRALLKHADLLEAWDVKRRSAS